MKNTMRVTTVITTAVIIILCVTAINLADDADGADTLTPVELDTQYLNNILSESKYQYPLDAGNAYVLTENIDIGNNYIMMAGDMSLDLAGHTITSSNNYPITVSTKDGSGTATISDSVGGGSVVGTKNSAISNTGNLVITGGTFKGPTYAVYQQYNGKSLTISGGTFEANRAINIVGGSLTILGGTISGTEAGVRATVYNGPILNAFINPVVTIEDGTITGNFGIVVEGRSNSNFDATLTVNGGSITGTNGSAVSGNGSKDNTHITINDGVLTGNNNPGIFHPQSGDLTVNGGTITGESGIQFCGSGSVVINGGTITGTYAEIDGPEKPSDQKDGAVIDGAALSIVSRGTGYQDDGTTVSVTVNGGTLISDNNSPVSSYRFQKNSEGVWVSNDDTDLTSSLESFDINGGSFEGPADKPSIAFDESQDSEGKYSVSGGTFTGGIEQSFIEDGVDFQIGSDGSVSVGDDIEDEVFIPPIWDDDDDYVPPIVPAQPEDSGDDDTTTIVACAAAAVVAALMAAFLILDRRH